MNRTPDSSYRPGLTRDAAAALDRVHEMVAEGTDIADVGGVPPKPGEVRVQRALADTAVPVPAIVLSDDGDLLSVPCYVMTRVAGLVVRDRLPAGFADGQAERAALGNALGDRLAELHAIDPASAGLADFYRPAGSSNARSAGGAPNRRRAPMCRCPRSTN